MVELVKQSSLDVNQAGETSMDQTLKVLCSRVIKDHNEVNITVHHSVVCLNRFLYFLGDLFLELGAYFLINPLYLPCMLQCTRILVFDALNVAD